MVHSMYDSMAEGLYYYERAFWYGRRYQAWLADRLDWLACESSSALGRS